MADGRLDPTPLATLDIYVGRSAPFLWMPASDDGSQEGTLYFQWFDRGSNRIKAFHPSRSGDARWQDLTPAGRSEEHTSELQSLMRISYAVFCLKKKK